MFIVLFILGLIEVLHILSFNTLLKGGCSNHMQLQHYTTICNCDTGSRVFPAKLSYPFFHSNNEKEQTSI